MERSIIVALITIVSFELVYCSYSSSGTKCDELKLRPQLNQLDFINDFLHPFCLLLEIPDNAKVNAALVEYAEGAMLSVLGLVKNTDPRLSLPNIFVNQIYEIFKWKTHLCGNLTSEKQDYFQRIFRNVPAKDEDLRLRVQLTIIATLMTCYNGEQNQEASNQLVLSLVDKLPKNLAENRNVSMDPSHLNCTTWELLGRKFRCSSIYPFFGKEKVACERAVKMESLIKEKDKEWFSKYRICMLWEMSAYRYTKDRKQKMMCQRMPHIIMTSRARCLYDTSIDALKNDNACALHQLFYNGGSPFALHWDILLHSGVDDIKAPETFYEIMYMDSKVLESLRSHPPQNDVSVCEEYDLITREMWDAGPLTVNKTSLLLPAARVFVHHSAGASTNMKRIQKDHRDQNYEDIGYHFLISSDGTVYEGRGWTKEGSANELVRGEHAGDWNTISFGVCLLGNFTAELPTSEALESLDRVIKCGVAKGLIHEMYSLHGHRDARQTECPGSQFYNEKVKKMKRFGGPLISF